MIAEVQPIDKARASSLLLAGLLVLTSCSNSDDAGLAGYAEIDPIEVSHPSGGLIYELLVKEGDTVLQGQPLARLTTAIGQSERRAADARINEARGELDLARALPRGETRDARVAAAVARIDQATAQRDGVSQQASELKLAAPRAGRIERVYYQVGERLPAQGAILSIIPDGSLFVRFFIPEDRVAGFPAGSEIRIDCAGCGAGLKGQVSWIASEPEFAPPMIQTRENQQRMTYRADIVLADPGKLHPGEPVTVVPAGGQR